MIKEMIELINKGKREAIFACRVRIRILNLSQRKLCGHNCAKTARTVVKITNIKKYNILKASSNTNYSNI